MERPPLNSPGGMTRIGSSDLLMQNTTGPSLQDFSEGIPREPVSPSGPLDSLDLSKLEGLTNEVDYIVQSLRDVETSVTGPGADAFSPKALDGINRVYDLTNPAALNRLKNNKDQYDRVVKAVENNDAMDAIVSDRGNVYVITPKGEISTKSREEVVLQKGQYRALTAAELLDLRNNSPQLLGDTRSLTALSQVIGMPAVTAEIDKALNSIGNFKAATLGKELSRVVAQDGKVKESNLPQAESALRYIRGALTSGMIETLKNQALLNVVPRQGVDTSKLIDYYVDKLLAEKAASRYSADFNLADPTTGEGGAGSPDMGIYGGIATESAALNWETVNFVDSDDPTKKYEALATTIPLTERSTLDQLVTVTRPGAKTPSYRSLGEMTDSILLANGKEVSPGDIEKSEEFYLTRATGRVVSLPDRAYKEKHENILRQINALNTQIMNLPPNRTENLKQQMELLQDVVRAVPKVQYFEYIVVTSPGNIDQPLFEQNNPEGEKAGAISGAIFKEVDPTNVFAIKESKSGFYDDLGGGLLNAPVEFPVFVRMDNMAYMDAAASKKYGSMLSRHKKQQQEAQDKLVRLTSRSIVKQ